MDGYKLHGTLERSKSSSRSTAGLPSLSGRFTLTSSTKIETETSHYGRRNIPILRGGVRLEQLASPPSPAGAGKAAQNSINNIRDTGARSSPLLPSPPLSSAALPSPLLSSPPLSSAQRPHHSGSHHHSQHNSHSRSPDITLAAASDLARLHLASVEAGDRPVHAPRRALHRNNLSASLLTGHTTTHQAHQQAKLVRSPSLPANPAEAKDYLPDMPAARYAPAADAVEALAAVLPMHTGNLAPVPMHVEIGVSGHSESPIASARAVEKGSLELPIAEKVKINGWNAILELQPYSADFTQQSMVHGGSSMPFRLLNHALDQSRIPVLRAAASNGKPWVIFQHEHAAQETRKGRHETSRRLPSNPREAPAVLARQGSGARTHLPPGVKDAGPAGDEPSGVPETKPFVIRRFGAQQQTSNSPSNQTKEPVPRSNSESTPKTPDKPANLSPMQNFIRSLMSPSSKAAVDKPIPLITPKALGTQRLGTASHTRLTKAGLMTMHNLATAETDASTTLGAMESVEKSTALVIARTSSEAGETRDTQDSPSGFFRRLRSGMNLTKSSTYRKS